ncbi:hypothetical protein C8R43DRAFT_1122761 [Mycena crocata]|nr:hypothetical protein C8R43DRAFT_1122761 [Mycena crocata]
MLAKYTTFLVRRALFRRASLLRAVSFGSSPLRQNTYLEANSELSYLSPGRKTIGTPPLRLDDESARNDWDADVQESIWERKAPVDRWDTVRIHNTPSWARVDEVLDLVMFGPIYRIDDSVENGSRVITLTFYHHHVAKAFYQDVAANKVDFYGRRLSFSCEWSGRPEIKRPFPSRALRINQSVSEEFLAENMSSYGPIDRIIIPSNGRAYVHYLSTKSCALAMKALRQNGIDASFTPDRCVIAGSTRATAIANRSRTVMLDCIPPDTSVADICDQIRGGSLERINFQPQNGTAFVHFVHDTSAVSFFRYALYRDLMVNERRVAARFVPTSVQMPRFMRDQIQLGATRCLAVLGIVDPEKLREESQRYGTVERVSVSESTYETYVSFTHVSQAVMALRRLPAKVDYPVVFIRDPCEEQYEEEIKEAAALQAEITSLLAPPGGETFDLPPEMYIDSYYR